MEIIKENLGLFIPLLIIIIGLDIFCIVDLFKSDRPIRGNKYLWLFLIIFVNPFGAIGYLLFGKGD